MMIDGSPRAAASTNDSRDALASVNRMVRNVSSFRHSAGF
jgi:hypothetical protein